MAYELNSERKVRAAFWRECGKLPGVSRKRITAYSGYGRMYNTDTRSTFADWLDGASRDNRLTQELAQRVTLSTGD